METPPPEKKIRVQPSSPKESDQITDPGGFKCNFVVKIPKEFLCPICGLPLRDPVQIQGCGHRFCKSCYQTYRRTNGSFCPEDGEVAEQYFEDNGIKRSVLDLAVRCKNQGCSWMGEIRDIEDHYISTCPFEMVSCSNKECDKTVHRHSLAEHVHFLCEKRLVVCRLCGTQSKVSEQDPHCKRHETQVQRIDFLTRQVELLKAELRKTKRGVHLWTLHNFHDRIYKAVSGKKEDVYSDIFHSEQYGYKMRARLCLNGAGSGKGTHMSIYIILLKGEYDPILIWPCKMKVIFTLLDQKEEIQERKDVIGEISSEDIGAEESFLRPVGEQNRGWGLPVFVSHEVLKSGIYIRKDKAFIRIEVEDYGSESVEQYTLVPSTSSGQI